MAALAGHISALLEAVPAEVSFGLSRIRTVLITVTIEILPGYFTRLGTFLNRKDYWNVASVSVAILLLSGCEIFITRGG